MKLRVLFATISLGVGLCSPVFAASKQQAEAVDAEAADPQPLPEAQFELDFISVAPAPLHLEVIGESFEGLDPTIIPYSGWHFFSADGESQPWRKRSARYTDNFFSPCGGQYLDPWSDEAFVTLLFRCPLEMRVGNASFMITNADDFAQFNSTRTSSSPNGYGGYGRYSYGFGFESINQIPNRFEADMSYQQGDWQDVATATPDTPLPVGDENVQIQYIGKPRANGVAMQAAAPRPPGEPPYEMEIQISGARAINQWEYDVQYQRSGDEGPLTSYIANEEVSDNEGNRYVLSLVKPDELESATIRRVRVCSGSADPVNLRALQSIPNNALVQQRIGLVDRHRFGQTESLEIETAEPGNACLLDLDTGTAVAMPDPQPEGDDWAAFLETHGIDLIAQHVSDGLTVIRPVACLPVSVPGSGWDGTPRQCVEEVRALSGVVFTTFPFNLNPGESPVLVTTAEGTMALVRVTQTMAKNGETARATVEIRRLELP